MYKNIRTEKAAFRQKHKKMRKEMASARKAVLDKRVATELLNTMAYMNATGVLLYYSLPFEVETKEIFAQSIKDGKSCYYPKCQDLGKMTFHRVYELDSMATGMFNLPEPSIDFPVYEQGPMDICIVPALTYDEEGYRMGYGKGYYDRFLSGFNGTKIGICYSQDIEKRLPRGKFDVKVDILITEKGLYKIR